MNLFSLKPESFGIDFSDLRIRIVKLKKKGKSLDLASWNKKTIPKGIIVDGEIKNEEKLISIIKEVVLGVKGDEIKAKHVVASLPENKSFLQVIDIPKMNEEELKTAIPFEAENYIPFPMNEVYLDYEIIPSANNSKALIGAMPRKVIDPYVSVIKRAGFKIKALEIESQSIIRALVKDHFSPFPILIIDFGKTTTSFIVFSGYSLRFTSSITISSNDLTRAIADSLNKDKQEAEKLKIQNGLKDKKIANAITPVLLELVKETKRYITYYQSHNKDKDIKKVFLCGKGVNLKGLPAFLFSELKIPIELANPWVNVFSSSRVPKITFQESLGYATAIGLALREND